MSQTNHEKDLIIRDEIHGDMQFDPLIRSAIDHPTFQRLRYIKQLGLAEYVFPCANHTRFQHSLGASYLARKYFERIMQFWASNNSIPNENLGSQQVLVDETRSLVQEVQSDSKSNKYWERVVCLAGLLHDVGHGPFSHTFENLDFRQDYSKEISCFEGVIARYFSNRQKKFLHEDLTLIYIHQLLSDILINKKEQNLYFLPIVSLIHSNLYKTQFNNGILSELENCFKTFEIKGGVKFHTLLRPIISGPFDVDRIDYIQRDGQNSGVSIGSIEWSRIINKLFPCLAKSSDHSPPEVILMTNIKNQHVLDDFVFSLFQMYAQVYLHPKIVALEEQIKKYLKNHLWSKQELVINFETHQKLTDETLMSLLRDNLQMPEIKDLLFRKQGYPVDVVSSPPNKVIQAKLKNSGYLPIEISDRPMMKENIPVYLTCPFRDLESQGEKIFLAEWKEVSPIAKYFDSIQYSPMVWIKLS